MTCGTTLDTQAAPTQEEKQLAARKTFIVD